VDYALKLMRKPRLFVEAKGLGETLSERRWIAQVLGYATVAGVEWCVLTDGDEWRFYNASAPIDAEEKMFCRVKLTEQPAPEVAKALSLLSRSNLEQNLLDALWVSHFVDRRVKGALRELLSGPGKTIIKLVRQQVPKLTPKEVADSIRRLNILIESPAVRFPEQGQTQPDRIRRVTPHRDGKKKKRGPGPGVSLADLLGAGMIKPGVRLFRRYKSRDLEAQLLPDGSVRFGNENFRTCSTAAEVARKSVTGRRMNTNGWVFWQFADSSGKPAVLDTLRRTFIERRPSAPPLRLAGAGESATAVG
jgi:hypothetical protein